MKKNSNNKHIGSSFDEFLEEEGILKEVNAVATKRVFVYELTQELEKQHLKKADLAKKMQTSRSSVERLLDPDYPSNLNSLINAAKALGKTLRLSLL